MLALDRALEAGLDVALLFTIYEGNTGRLRFHGVRRELIQAQATSLGIELLARSTHPADYAAVFEGVLDTLVERGIGGVVFGNIHLEEIRAWYEERTTGRGLEHREPLWGGNTSALVAEFLARGHRTRVVSVDLSRGKPDWVGRELTPELAAEIAAVPGADPAGEQGEYHTFAHDGPLLARPIAHRVGEAAEREGHRFVDLVTV